MSTDGRPSRRLVVLGGSGASTPELADAIATWPGGDERRPHLEIVLHGRSRPKLELVADAFRRRVATLDPPVAVTTTEDLEQALDGVDAILNQVRVGGLAAREFDETFPHAFGLPGEETMGPGGAANAMRTVPALAPTWEIVARRAPEATVINLTNPSGIVVGTAVRSFGLRIVSVCDSPVTLTEAVSARLERDLDSVRQRYIGCNHVGWWMPLRVSDLDRVSDLATGLDPEGVAIAGALPGPYVRYYLAPDRVLAAQRASKPRAVELQALQAAQLEAYASGAEAAPRRGAIWYAKAVVPFLDAWWGGSDAPQILGLPTDGTVPGIPDGVVVERAVRLSEPGSLELLPPPALETYPGAVLAAHAAYEALMIDALATGAERRALVRAMAANPMVRGLDQAAAIVDRILESSPRG
jgi:6-phospho-beta-glucosidase